MKSNEIILAVFTGTGNTLLMARLLASALSDAGRKVSLVSMESPEGFTLPEGAALGLAAPVACFSTYPTTWRFVDALPEGQGREAFFLGTMGGVGGGMDGPIRKVLLRKRYLPVGSKIVTMPSNYGNEKIPAQRNATRAAAAERAVRRYAQDLLSGSAVWGGGKPLVSALFAALAHGRKPWNFFYRMFPLTVSPEKCVGCGVCADICPEKNIALEAGKALIGNRCQSCQRCVGFCPVDAISVPGKAAERYRSVSLEDIRELRK